LNHRLHLLGCNLAKTALLGHTIATETAKAAKALLLLRHTIATITTKATETLLGHTEATEATETLLGHTEAAAEAAAKTTEALLLGHTEATAKTTEALLLLGHLVKALPCRLESTTEAALWLPWLLLLWLLRLTAEITNRNHITYLS
jgi:hypothetical protein